MAELIDQEMLRYNRQIILRGFDFDGQEALKDSRVLVVGLGGLGCPARQRVRTASPLKKSPGRLDFQRGVLQRNADGELEVTTTGHQGSHIFSSFSLGNCFIVLERDRGKVEAGEWGEVEPLNALFGGL